MVAHPSANNKVVGSNPRSSIFLRGQAGAPQLHFFLGQVGAAWVRPAGARCGRPGLAWVRPRPTTVGWDLADRGQGVAGRGRSQPLPPFVIFLHF
jgi:hypothetical protein